MPLPSFSVTGNLNDIPGANLAGELVTTAWTAASLRFTDNTRAPHIVLWDGELHNLPRPVTVYVSDDGSISDEDNPVLLLANDDGLNVTGLQYTVEIVVNNSVVASWPFDAPDDGGTVDLGTVAHAPGVTAAGVVGVSEAQLLALIEDGDSDVHDAIVALGAGFFDLPATTHAATGKTTPVNADELALVDSAASNGLKKLTWANLKAAILAAVGASGTAATLTTARNIDGQAFNGSANITVIAPGTHAATGKTTPADADELALVDSAASNVLKKLTWLNLKKQASPVVNVKHYGTNSAAVAAAITAAPSGGEVYFPTGTYDISAVSAVDKPLRIYGAGPSSILKLNAKANFFGLDTVSNVIIENLAFDGDRAVVGSDFREAIFMDDCTDVLVRNCSFANMIGGAINITHGQRIRVTGNRFTNVWYMGVGLREPDDEDNYNEDIWITDNYFDQTQLSNVAGNSAIEAEHTGRLSNRYIHVHNNIVHRPEVVGIGLDSLSTSTIRGNIVIKDETCSDGEAIGFTGSDCVLSDNYCHNDSTVSGGAILFWAAAAFPCVRNQIINNRCTNGGQGIVIVWAQQDTAIDDLLVQGNHCYGNNRGIQSYVYPGVTAGSQSRILVSGNNLAGNTADALLLHVGSGITGDPPVAFANIGAWVTERVTDLTPSATPAVNTDDFDVVGIYGLSAAITSMTTNLTGTPRHGERKTFRFQDDGTPRAITWGSMFTGHLLATTVTFKTHVQELIYDVGYGKWAGTFVDTAGY